MKKYVLHQRNIQVFFSGSDFTEGLSFCKAQKYRFNANGKYWEAPLTIETIELLKRHKYEEVKETSAIEAKPRLDYMTTILDTTKLNPLIRDFQIEGLKFALHRDRILLNFYMGLGKTLIGCHYLAQLPIVEHKYKVILCPAGLKTMWQRELMKWNNLPSEILSGRTPYTPIKDVILIINYDIISAWMQYLSGKISAVIVDESHNLANPSGKTKAFMSLQRTIKNILFLSGTPIKGKIGSFYNQLKVLAPTDFSNKARFLERYTNPFSGLGVNLEELRERIKPFVLTKTTREVITTLPEEQRIVITIDGNKAFDAENKAVELLMESGNLSEMEKKTKLRELARSAYFAKRTMILEYIDELLEEDESPLCLVCVHHKVMQDLLDKYKCPIINGNVKDKQGVIDAFEKGNDKVIILQAESSKEGFSILRSSRMLFVEYVDTWSTVVQVEARILRMTSTHKYVQYFYPVVTNSIEENQIKNFIAKGKDATHLLLGESKNHLKDATRIKI